MPNSSHGSLPEYRGSNKWHHFAYEAETERLVALTKAVEAWVGFLDLSVMQSFVSAHPIAFDPGQEHEGKTVAITPNRAAEVARRCRMGLANVQRIPPDLADHLLEPLERNRDVTAKGRLRVDARHWRSLTRPRSILWKDDFDTSTWGEQWFISSVVYDLAFLAHRDALDERVLALLDDVTDLDPPLASAHQTDVRWDAPGAARLYSAALARCASSNRSVGVGQHLAVLSKAVGDASLLMPVWIPASDFPLHVSFFERFGRRVFGARGETTVSWASGDLLHAKVEELTRLLEQAESHGLARVVLGCLRTYRDACADIGRRGQAVLTIEGENPLYL